MKIAAVQTAPVFLDPAATTKKAIDLMHEAARNGAELVAFPETFLSGYPIWMPGVSSKLLREERQRLYGAYLAGAVHSDGAEMAAIAETARELGMFVYMGFIERPRDVPMAYCSLAPIHPERGILAVHRKVKPTEFERLIWAEGDAHGMRVHDWNGARIGGLCCFENLHPLYRYTLYAQGEQIHVSVWPGVAKNTVPASTWTAREGRVFVLAAAGVIGHSDIPETFPLKHHAGLEKGFKTGGSVIAAPSGDILAGPVSGEETILYADVDPAQTYAAREQSDPAGHYLRPDLFKLSVDFSRHKPLYSGTVGEFSDATRREDLHGAGGGALRTARSGT